MIRKLLILCALLALTACSSGGSSSGSGSAAPTKIVALGDSLGARSPNWPSIVSQNSGIPVSNYSRDSRTTSNFVNQIGSILDSEQPSHVLILLGTNDARGGNVGGAIANLQAMANEAKARGIIAVIGTIPPNLQSNSANANAAAISAGIRGLSDANIAEVRDALGSGIGLFPDGLHPNAEGSNLIADAFLNSL